MNDQKNPETPDGTLDEMGPDTKATKETMPASMEESMLFDAHPDYIAPDQQDLMLTDVTSEKLHSVISAVLETEHLSPAMEKQPFPLFGVVTGFNKRLMVNVATRHFSHRPNGPNYPAFHVIFVCDTGSPCTFLCAEAIWSCWDHPAVTFFPKVSWSS